MTEKADNTESPVDVADECPPIARLMNDELTCSLAPVNVSVCSLISSRTSKPQRIAPNAPESATVQLTFKRGTRVMRKPMTLEEAKK